MRKLYKFATWMAIAVFAATSFSSCDDDKTTNEEPPKAPTLEIGSVSLNEDYEAEVTITPSENATSFSWGYSLETAEPESYTKIDGAEAKAVKTPALAPGKYKISAYAENEVGKSAVMTKAFEVVLNAPTVKFGEAKVSRGGIAVPMTVMGSENFKYAYVMQEGSTEPAIPEEESFKSRKIDQLTDGNLVVGSNEINENGTYFIFAYAENEAGKGTVAKTSAVFDDTTFPKLVDFEIINKTAYSFDVKVTMKEGCTRYALTGYIGEGTYSKKDFIESAKRSFNPDPSYPIQPYNYSDKSATFPEALLGKGKLASSDESEGLIVMYENDEGILKYQVAVYAEDADGNGTAYASELFTVVPPEFGQTPTVKITADADLRYITAKYEPSGECAKIVRGFFRPAWTSTDIDWNNPDPTAVVELLSTLANSKPPHIYKLGEPLIEKLGAMFDPHEDVIAYAIPISKDGKLGKLTYEKFTTKSPEMTGNGHVELELTETSQKYFKYKVTLSNGAKKVRIGAYDDMAWSKVGSDLDWTFFDPNNAGNWQEYSEAELTASNNIVQIAAPYPATTYKIRAATIDAAGNVSPVQEFPDQTTLAEEEVKSIDFTLGKGEAKINVIKEQTYYTPAEGEGAWYTPESWSMDLTYSVSKGANTVEVYRALLQDMVDEASIMAEVKDRYKVPADLPSPWAVDVEKTQSYMADYDPDWGGTAIAIITKDADGNYKVADWYIGKPDHNVKDERP